MDTQPWARGCWTLYAAVKTQSEDVAVVGIGPWLQLEVVVRAESNRVQPTVSSSTRPSRYVNIPSTEERLAELYSPRNHTPAGSSLI